MTSSSSPSLRETQQLLGQYLLQADGKQQLDAVIQKTSGKLVDWRKPLTLYNDLINSTTTATLESIFPMTRRFFKSFYHLVESFRRQNPPQQYQLYLGVEAFPQFIAQQPQAQQFPFLLQLADYEWREVFVQNFNSTVAQNAEAILPTLDNVATYQPVWNDASVLAQYQYDLPAIVEQIRQAGDSFDAASLNAQDFNTLTTVLIYRDTDTLKPRFFKLNGLTAQVIAVSQANPQLSLDAVLQVLKQLPVLARISDNALMSQGIQLLQKLHQANILLGCSV